MDEFVALPTTTEQDEDFASGDVLAQGDSALYGLMEASQVGPFVNPLTSVVPDEFPGQGLDNSSSPEPLEGEVLPASHNPWAPRKPKTSVLAVLEEEAGPPTAEYLAALALEATAIQTQSVGLDADRQPRKGNRRPRRRADKDGKPVRNLPAVDDPIILRRRQIAMPLWNKGLNGTEVREGVNEWLASQGLSPVGPETIRIDKEAIYRDWELDYDASSAKNRAAHIASLNRMKREAWQSYEFYHGQVKGATAASQFLKICVQIESELAILDGSKKRAEVAATAEAEMGKQTRITRVYLGVNIEDLDNAQNQLEVSE